MKLFVFLLFLLLFVSCSLLFPALWFFLFTTFSSMFIGSCLFVVTLHCSSSVTYRSLIVLIFHALPPYFPYLLSSNYSWLVLDHLTILINNLPRAKDSYDSCFTGCLARNRKSMTLFPILAIYDGIRVTEFPDQKCSLMILLNHVRPGRIEGINGDKTWLTKLIWKGSWLWIF